MIPSIFDIGVDAADYVAPYPVSYTNWDLCEGLPDEELTEVCFKPDFSAKLLEEAPDACAMPVVDEADFGDE